VTVCVQLSLTCQGEHARSKVSVNFDPRRLPAIRMQRREPLSSRYVTGDRASIYPLTSNCTLFRSGKMNCVGTRHEEQARKILRRYARIVEKAQFPARFQDFRIANFAATASVGFSVSLQSLASHPAHAMDAEYEPELSAGVSFCH
jgi:hypothetical protein